MLSNTDEIEEKSTSGQIGHQGKSRDKIGDEYDLSGKTVSRYLRIDTLLPELKERLDKNEIPFTSAVDLSFLKDEEQEIVETILDDYGFKVDLKKSEILKAFAQGRNFKYEKAHEVLSGKYFNKPKKVKSFKLKPKLISKYFKENQTQKEIEEIIENALEQYFLQEGNNLLI